MAAKVKRWLAPALLALTAVAAVLVAYAAGVATTLSSRYEVLKIERES